MELARENLNTLSDFYDEIKKEKARAKSSQLIYEPPRPDEPNEPSADKATVEAVFEQKRQ